MFAMRVIGMGCFIVGCFLIARSNFMAEDNWPFGQSDLLDYLGFGLLAVGGILLWIGTS